MSSSLSFPVWGLSAAVVFATWGCSSKSADHPDLGTVTGIVTLDGAPLADAIIEFLPERGRPSGALTDHEGRYKLAYTSDAQGAIVGTHSIRISTERYAPQPDGSTIPIPEKLPAKYHQKSTLTEEVKEGSNQFNFELTSK
ncbi:MAG TPA: hypothetical protein VNQ76_19535 [Planctomicrobium sp.]|nr:hypothetical protein [Planctomicrobium sp.]